MRAAASAARAAAALHAHSRVNSLRLALPPFALAGNGALSRDGRTFFVALNTGADMDATYFAFDLATRTLAGNYTVPPAAWPNLITAEVVSC